ncbi:MAG: hypothetical protein JNK05_14640 [Myxococcales bacterium]|nr:hypothetical protein [Myxococcales bacterium]
MSDETTPVEAQWIQCSTCARHVRAHESGCPFCARDAKVGEKPIAPAAAVIAALVALVPTDTLAERRAGGVQRGAQSIMQVQAYGAPAPAYGLAPPPVDDQPPPANVTASVTAITVRDTDSRRSRLNIMRSVRAVQTCADRALPAARANRPPVSVAVLVEVRLSSSSAPTTSVRSAPRIGALDACISNALRGLTWAQPEQATTASVRWTYRLSRPAPARGRR